MEFTIKVKFTRTRNIWVQVFRIHLTRSRGHSLPVWVYKWFQGVPDFRRWREWFQWIQKLMISSTAIIVLDDFSKLHMIRNIDVRFECDIMRFQTLFVKIRNQWLKSRLTLILSDFLRFLMIAFFILNGSMISLVNGLSDAIQKGKRRRDCATSFTATRNKRIINKSSMYNQEVMEYFVFLSYKYKWQVQLLEIYRFRHAQWTRQFLKYIMAVVWPFSITSFPQLLLYISIPKEALFAFHTRTSVRYVSERYRTAKYNFHLFSLKIRMTYRIYARSYQWHTITLFVSSLILLYFND